MNSLDKSIQPLNSISIILLAIGSLFHGWNVLALTNQNRDFQERISALEQTQCFNEESFHGL